MRNSIRYLGAGALLLLLFTVPIDVSADPPERAAICHATSSADNPYSYLVLPPSALSTHLDDNGSPRAGHEQDFFPTDGDCDRSNDPGGPPGEPPAAVPEPITILLFGAGLAGAGYVSRKYLKRGEKDEEQS